MGRFALDRLLDHTFVVERRLEDHRLLAEALHRAHRDRLAGRGLDELAREVQYQLGTTAMDA